MSIFNVIDNFRRDPHLLHTEVVASQAKEGGCDVGLSRRRLLQSAAAAGATMAAATVLTPRKSAAASLRSVAQWEQMVLKIWNSGHSSQYLPWSVSADSRNYYDLAYAIDGNAAMFQATGKTTYLDRAILYIENIIRDARPSSSFSGSNFKDSYSGWICKSSGSYYGEEVVLYEIYLWRYVTRLLRLMQSNSAVWANSTYRQKFSTILAFTERNIFDKWYARGPNSYVYREVTHITAHFGYIALDLSRMTSDSTRRSRCTAVFNNINTALPNRPGCSMRKQLINHPTVSNGYFWNMSWGSFARPGGDVAHANGVVSYIVEAEELGAEWTRSDVTRLINTLNGAVWPTTTRSAYYVDGSGTGGWLNDGWIKLGRYSSALQQRIEGRTSAENIQLWANGALNAKILLSGV